METRKFRIQVPSAVLHANARFRIRLAATDNGPVVGLPFDDTDPFIIDALQISAPTSGKESDLEPVGFELGAKYFKHIPRDVKFITPKIRIASNGLQATLAVYQIRLVLWDALGREVYHQKQSLVAPAPHSEVELSMLGFPIEGSQGGVFTARVTVEQMFSDYYRSNDTNFFYRSLAIDDVYAYDDGVPDTVGTMTAIDPQKFYYTFKPLRTDSLRGMEFYHLSATGGTNWVITFRQGGVAKYVRSLNYDVLTRGFQRAIFNKPVPLSADSTYVIECSMTQGFALGGDASLGLVGKDQDNHYWILHPNVLADFSDSTTGSYASLTSPKNGAAGGPLLPMMRLVYRGSAQYLPVELVSLHGKRTINNAVAIDFATAAESDAHSFIVDRLVDGIWQEAAQLPAKNALRGASYSVIDAQAPNTDLIYRLSARDLDGSEHMLGTISVGPNGGEFGKLLFTPNPAHDFVHLVLPAFSATAEATLFDVAGRNVKKVVLDGTDPMIGLEDLTKGMYMLEVIAGSRRYYAKLWVD